MVRPPSQAPAAFPTLKAAMLAPLARVGAEPAYVMIRICTPGTVANPNVPMSTRLTTAMTGDERPEHDGEGDRDRPVGRAATGPVAGEQPQPEQDQQPRHGRRGEPADLSERVGDVGERPEHPTEPEDG